VSVGGPLTDFKRLVEVSARFEKVAGRELIATTGSGGSRTTPSPPHRLEWKTIKLLLVVGSGNRFGQGSSASDVSSP